MKYLYLQSALHQNTELKERAAAFFETAGKELGISFSEGTPGEVDEEPVCLLYIATGGTAGLVKKALGEFDREKQDKLIVLITQGSQNSLSASMEALTYMTRQGRKAKLLHGSREELCASVCAIVRGALARRRVCGMRLAMIGEASDWLISTAVDEAQLKSELGIETVHVKMDELVQEIKKKSYPDTPKCRELLEKPFDREQVEQALHIYGAFKRIVEKYRLDGASVRCFDLLTLVENTGCLGLALLNASGIYGGCESDFPSLISMALLGKITGKPVFQCNPSRVDRQKNEIVFAHCTLPLDMPESYTLDTHFESGIGVAIAADISPGRVTIFKLGADLHHYFLSSGEIIEDLHESDLCRTQIKVHCDVPADDFLNSHVGNHYLVCLGDYVNAVDAFFGKC